jgi:hypothetical protein
MTLRRMGEVLLCGLTFTALFFPLLGWKGLVSLVPLWVAFEIFLRLRLRAHLPCPACGFDPYKFLVDPEGATEQIRTRLQAEAERGVNL